MDPRLPGAFDRPDTNASCPRRAVTTIAPQALTLLNDPVYVEAAHALAGRIVAETPGASVPERIRHAFRLCKTSIIALFAKSRHSNLFRKLTKPI